MFLRLRERLYPRSVRSYARELHRVIRRYRDRQLTWQQAHAAAARIYHEVFSRAYGTNGRFPGFSTEFGYNLFHMAILVREATAFENTDWDFFSKLLQDFPNLVNHTHNRVNAIGRLLGPAECYSIARCQDCERLLPHFCFFGEASSVRIENVFCDACGAVAVFSDDFGPLSEFFNYADEDGMLAFCRRWNIAPPYCPCGGVLRLPSTKRCPCCGSEHVASDPTPRFQYLQHHDWAWLGDWWPTGEIKLAEFLITRENPTRFPAFTAEYTCEMEAALAQREA